MSKFTGIDISKQTFDCSITKEDGTIETKKMGNNLKGFEKLKTLLPSDAVVVMEASGAYYFKLATYLHGQNIKVCVVNPLVIRRFCQMRMIRTKTDRKDASMIREYGLTEHPSLWQPDEPSITKLKQLNAAIELMDKGITASKNQLEAFKEMPDTDADLIKALEKNMETNMKAKEKLEVEMEKVAITNYSASYKALQTIPGIGPKSSAIIIAVTGNFEKFSNYKQLIAYVGLNPRVFESGTSVKGRGHICKMGTSRLRKLLYLCSWSAKRHNVYCKEMYERLKAKAKPERVIKIAIACKLLRQAFAVGKSQTNFKINYQLTIAN
jgi:transposase